MPVTKKGAASADGAMPRRCYEAKQTFSNKLSLSYYKVAAATVVCD